MVQACLSSRLAGTNAAGGRTGIALRNPTVARWVTWGPIVGDEIVAPLRLPRSIAHLGHGRERDGRACIGTCRASGR